MYVIIKGAWRHGLNVAKERTSELRRVELVYKVFVFFHVLSKAYSILFSSGINAGCLRGCGYGGEGATAQS